MIGLFSLFGMLLVGLGLDAASSTRDDDEAASEDFAESAEPAEESEVAADEEAASMLEDFKAEFRAETGLFGEEGLVGLFGAEARADIPEEDTGSDEVTVIEGYDPEAERLILGYDPELNPAPEVNVEAEPSDTGGTETVIRLDGAEVARVLQEPGVPPVGLDDVALVPIMEIAADA